MEKTCGNHSSAPASLALTIPEGSLGGKMGIQLYNAPVKR